MHRRPLLRQLAAHRSADGREELHRRTMLAFVMAQPDCFRRELAEGHITGSAWIVDPAMTQALLVHHRKLGRWLQPGGHADGDANPARVARREAEEETGLADLRAGGDGIFDVDIHTIPARGEVAEHLHYDVRYLLIADPSAPLTVSAESHALAWRPLETIVAEDEESLARMARKTLALRG